MSAKRLAPPLAAAFWLAALPAAWAGEDAAKVRIARIEQGLRPAVALQGQPVKTSRLQDEMRRLHVPGVSVAVIRGGKLAWARGYGVAYEGGPAVTPRTLFQAASISKPVTALGTLRLAEQGKLDLDAGVDTLLTSWKLPEGAGKPSVRQLLSHTAGTTVSGFPGYAADKPVPTLVQVLDGQAPANTDPVRVEAAPGSAWNYSGGGYTVLQQALIDRSGKPFDALMRDTVLAPLGMKDSAFAQPLPAARKARAALPHDREGKAYAGGPYTYPEMAAAGLWTTPSDLAKFAIGVQQAAAGRAKAVLSPDMARAMLTPVRNDYGLGVEIDVEKNDRAFAHGGSNMGFQNSLYAFVDHGDGAIVMTNGDNGGALAQGLMRAIATEYGWPSHATKLRPAVPLSPAQHKALAGRYEVPGMGHFEVAEREGVLMVALREGQWEPLYAESDKLLFVLSRELDLQPADADSGRILSGSFEVPYKRVR